MYACAYVCTDIKNAIDAMNDMHVMHLMGVMHGTHGVGGMRGMLACMLCAGWMVNLVCMVFLVRMACNTFCQCEPFIISQLDTASVKRNHYILQLD